MPGKTTKEVKLSVAIITYNEEKNIGKCLDQAKHIADDIVVVDSFSTDATREICESKGARVITNAFEGYIQQKNFATQQAIYDHILSIDADEIISNELANSIKVVKNNWTKSAYYLLRRSHYCGKFINHGDWYPDKKIRLFERSCGYWGGINPHDTFLFHHKVMVGKLKGDLEHFTYNSVAEHILQARKFSSIGAEEIVKSGKRIYLPQVILRPLWRFFRSYVLFLGFLDGLRGFTISTIIGLESFLKYLQAYWPVFKHPLHDLNVLLISAQKTWRGGEQQVMYLAEELQKRGVFVHLLVEKQSYLESRARMNGLHYSTTKFANGYSLFSALKLKKLCNRLQIDIVHLQCSPSHTSALLSFLLGNKTPYVLSRRVNFPIRANAFSKWKYNHEQIKKILCVSDSVKSILKSYINRVELLEVVHDGVDIKKLTDKTNVTSTKTDFGIRQKYIITIVAALTPEKDHITFLKMAGILASKRQDIHFLIVGSGPEEKKIRHTINSYHLDDLITMTGFRTDVPNILNFSDIFILTSRQEGLGSSIIEAFTNKVPVIASNVGGIPELVIDNETGLLAQPGNAEQFACGVERLLDDTALCQKITSKAWNLLVNNFTIDCTANETLKIYKSVLSRIN